MAFVSWPKAEGHDCGCKCTSEASGGPGDHHGNCDRASGASEGAYNHLVINQSLFNYHSLIIYQSLSYQLILFSFK
jgi:hypothetical protein